VHLRRASALHFPDHERFVALHTQGHLSSPEQAAKRVLAYLAHPSFGQQPVDDARD
jgi:hypothetical protein